MCLSQVDFHSFPGKENVHVRLSACGKKGLFHFIQGLIRANRFMVEQGQAFDMGFQTGFDGGLHCGMTPSDFGRSVFFKGILGIMNQQIRPVKKNVGFSGFLAGLPSLPPAP